MREAIIQYLKLHTGLTRFVWKWSKLVLLFWGRFVPVHQKTMIFCSFGGRKFDDSPKAIYEEVCRRNEFEDWRLIWAFVNPSHHDIPRGEKVKVDTYQFFKMLLSSKVWVSNSGMDRGIDMNRKDVIRVETWHGTPLKKIGGDENKNSLGINPSLYKGKKDADTIRCAQSDYDRAIFERVMHADKSAILLSDLPRNDGLLKYTDEDIVKVKRKIGIPDGKKVLLYAPTYREYLVDDHNDTIMAPPINFDKWKKELGENYVLLIRAHYAVTAAMEIRENDFVKNVSDYPFINDLYVISDILLSDYSSSYIDYSILDKPMLCYAYDVVEYKEKRGLYIDLQKELPCEIDYDEESLLNHIKTLDYSLYSEQTKKFHRKYAPYAGNASKKVVDEIVKRL